jgi:hypothetical protein
LPASGSVTAGATHDVDELQDDLPATVGDGAETLGHGDVLAAGRREDVEIAQHLGAVDRHIELALAGRAIPDLGKVQTYR